MVPVVVVSGADTDDGAAHARALVGAVRAVVLCGRDTARLGVLAAELRPALRVAIVCGDLATQARQLAEMVAELFVAASRDDATT
jgi:NADP-dependent 3-hydroxy acid dehydrogenase YdfG